ncbi:MAG TPA: DNRLRE domain-containing protein [Jiangellaceae bacterium]
MALLSTGPGPFRCLVLGAGALTALVATGIAFAALLGVTSESVTVHTAASNISPTICTLSAADADSYVSSGSTSSNFGTATTLNVQASGILGSDMRTFVEFSLSSCSIPASSLVTAASLELYLYAAPTAGRTYDAHRVTASWTETGITWSNQPGAAGAATSSVSTGTTDNVRLTWDVTSDVQAFVDGTANNGWRIRDQDETPLLGTQLGQFRSAEHGTASQRPMLEITYYP